MQGQVLGSQQHQTKTLA